MGYEGRGVEARRGWIGMGMLDRSYRGVKIRMK